MDSGRAAMAAAAVLAGALGLDGGPESLAGELERVRSAPPESAYTIELVTAGGSVPFLLFAFELAGRDADGRSGAEMLADAARAMARAAELDAPGPRLVAQAEAGEWGVLLATTPAGLAALSGERTVAQAPAAAMGDPDALRLARATAAGALEEALRLANARAADLLALPDAPAGTPRTIEEASLAMLLTDGRALEPLTRAMRVVVERARG